MDVSQNDDASTPPEHHPDVVEKLAKLRRLIATSTAFSQFISERMQTQKKQRSATKMDEDVPEPDANGKRKSGAAISSASKRVKTEGEESSKSTTKDDDLYIKQPKTVTGATLRDYQLAGVQWLTLLYENGD